jgi:hypothetical protein
MDDRPRGRPKTKGRHQQPQSPSPAQHRQQPPQTPQRQAQPRPNASQLAAPAPKPPPGHSLLRVNQDKSPQQGSNVGKMTSQLAAMQSISRAMKQFGPQDKSNRKKASNYNAENSEHEYVISQPDVDHISTRAFDQQDNNFQSPTKKDIVNDDQVAPENFKAARFSSLQLKTAKHLLEKERKELKHKKTIDMFMDPRTETTPYIDHYEERTNLESLMLAAYIVSTPGCHEMFVCKSCNTEVKDRQGFRKHSHT